MEPIHAKYQVEAVDMESWIAELKQIKNPQPEDLSTKPALKLLDFYQSLVEGQGALSVPIEMKQAKAASKTMGSLLPITPCMMANWLNQWDF